MSRGEVIVGAAAILFLAFALGWFACWIMHRLTRVTQADLTEMDGMAQALHEAEDVRDQAVEWVRQREAEMVRELAQKDAEIEAAMDALRAARGETEELRAYVERVNHAL